MKSLTYRAAVMLILLASLPSGAGACIERATITTDSPTLYIERVDLAKSHVEVTMTLDPLAQRWRIGASHGSGLFVEIWMDRKKLVALELPGAERRQTVVLEVPGHFAKGEHVVVAALKQSAGILREGAFSSDALNVRSRCVQLR